MGINTNILGVSLSVDIFGRTAKGVGMSLIPSTPVVGPQPLCIYAIYSGIELWTVA